MNTAVILQSSSGRAPSWQTLDCTPSFSENWTVRVKVALLTVGVLLINEISGRITTEEKERKKNKQTIVSCPNYLIPLPLTTPLLSPSHTTSHPHPPHPHIPNSYHLTPSHITSHHLTPSPPHTVTPTVYGEWWGGQCSVYGSSQRSSWGRQGCGRAH